MFSVIYSMNCHHHHLSLNHKNHWGTTDDFATSFVYFAMFSTSLWDLANSSPVHSHLFSCLSCLLPPFTVPSKMALARPDEWETCPHHFCLRLFTMVRRSSCSPIACWLLAQTSYDGQEVFVWSDCLLDLGTDFLKGISILFSM